jgi:transcriptional regulator with XRE-family HTH domain
MSNLPTRFKLIRNIEGKTQKDFAKTLDVSIPAIQNYESGKSYPSGRILKSLAMRGYSTDWLLIGRGEMKAENLLFFTDIDLLKDVIEKVDEYFRRIEISLPRNLRDKLVLHIYHKARLDKSCLQTKTISKTLTSILSMAREFSAEPIV